MSRTIRREPAGGPRRTVNRRKPAPKKTFGQRMVAKLPFNEAFLRRAVTWTLLGAGGAAVIAVASWIGIPSAIGIGIAETAAQAGLRVEQVDITGLKRMDRETVYAVALEQPSRAMLRLDLEAVRQRLLAYGWIEDAYVSRRLPDRLLIHVTEREPAAVWQDNGQLTLIDATGRLLAPVDRANMPNLPLVIGPGADRQEPAYQALLAAAPALRRRVKAAAWVGNRRWDLTFTTGETLALPQDGAQAALVKFADMERASPLLGKGWLRFDMRDPAKLVARKPGQDAQAARADDAPETSEARAVHPLAAGNV
ncbi:cell division protein FtsQ/DivIB [uncultured Sphingomonas sp.]|uniref:cell division protein FtsQ/DivIB n=1 Tax=uncultured Sphingomonas sp. TaxID=158754 RepID=UPI0025DBBC9D|nr:cell division protein FtsQ/DivIB [uncultured Sphingomonas sp.]